MKLLFDQNLSPKLVSLTGGNDPETGDIYAGLDRFGRIKDVRWRNTASNTDLSRIQYGYDLASNRTWRENSIDSSRQYDWKYGYDGLQRLKDGDRGTLNGAHTEITSPQFAQCWTLDATGNWQGFKQSDDGTSWALEQTRAANPVNELTTINATVGEQWANPAYDKNGNMTTIPRPGMDRPSWANLTTDQWATLTAEDWSRLEVAPTFQATFDAWNRLVKLTDGGDGTTVQENQYDGRGYRVVTKTYASGTLTETRHADFTDSWQIIEERLGTSTTPDRQFIWGLRYIDDLILRDQPTSGGPLYALQDANWNVTAIADLAGDVQERYEYDPYGVTTVLAPDFATRATSTVDWETTYCGYRWDQSTGLFAVRNRFYSPCVGTWLSRDPLGGIDGPNLVAAYFAPRTTDPFGLFISLLPVERAKLGSTAPTQLGHYEITASAMRSLGIKRECWDPTARANCAIDTGQLRCVWNTGTFKDDRYHATGGMAKLDGGVALSIQYWSQARSLCDAGQMEELWENLGAIFHFIQDVYAHTNWVPLNGGFAPAEGRFPALNGAAALNGVPLIPIFGMHDPSTTYGNYHKYSSGRLDSPTHIWPLDLPSGQQVLFDKFTAGNSGITTAWGTVLKSHADMNMDSPTSTIGMLRNSVGERNHDLAINAAIRHTKHLMKTFIDRASPACKNFLKRCLETK